MTSNANRPLRFTKMPILLSALVYPGVGQFVQRRWFWGLVYLGGFTLATGVVSLLAFKYFRIEFKDLTYFKSDWISRRADNPYKAQLVKYLSLWAAVYGVNILDTCYGLIRLRKNMPKPPPLPPS